MWRQIIDAVSDRPLLTTPEAFGSIELAALDAGEAAIIQLWHQLGVHLNYSDSGLNLLVTAPARDSDPNRLPV